MEAVRRRVALPAARSPYAGTSGARALRALLGVEPPVSAEPGKRPARWVGDVHRLCARGGLAVQPEAQKKLER